MSSLLNPPGFGLSACACLGPLGDCPCLRKQRGQKLDITETYVSPEIFNLLSDEDKTTINELKQKAFFAYMLTLKS